MEALRTLFINILACLAETISGDLNFQHLTSGLAIIRDFLTARQDSFDWAQKYVKFYLYFSWTAGHSEEHYRLSAAVGITPPAQSQVGGSGFLLFL